MGFHTATRGSINGNINEIFVNRLAVGYRTNADIIVLAYLKGYHNTVDDVAMTFR